ncbi:MAG: hypothetical protein QOD74_1675 [Variibacter sp.]|jgi:hypothetical protein|nr:hypothetical protein [Variibacter sp.]
MSLPRVESAPTNAAEGDFRGPYGFGRAAHKADPNASYGFASNPPVDDSAATPARLTAEEPVLTMFVSIVSGGPAI